MYHALVRRKMRWVFDRLSAGDWDAVLPLFAEDVRHVLPGTTPVGGERTSRAAVASWFERWGRLFPSVRFEVQEIVSAGWPWSTWVAVDWTADVTPASGMPYRNSGSQWVHLRWGRVTYIKEHHDVALVAEACRQMVVDGVDEAAAAPIAA
jgi:ketosteroid isomerase-like protein